MAMSLLWARRRGVVGNTIGGAAYVFRRQGSTWKEEAKLVASDPAYHDFFGSAVAISGNRIVVGAKEEDAKGDAAGAAYVFVGDTTSGEWTESQKLTADDGDDGHNFGYSVSIDDGRILIGVWLADGSVNTTGAAYHFRTEGNAWAQERKLMLSNGEYGDGYGNSVSISGPCGIVGAVNRDINDVEKVGAAYRYCNLPGPIPAEVELDIICCFQPPDPAGPVIVTTRIVNAGEGRVIGRRWIESVAPDGTAEVVVGPEAITLGAGEAREERHVFRRPGGAGAALPVLRLRWEDSNGIRTVQARNQPTRG